MVQSGDPVVDPTLVVPYHTGIQTIKMDDMEFVQRCMKTKGVSKEYAQALRSKLWQMHVDSQRPRIKASECDQHKQSSQVRPDIAKIPFKERIRPGMVVRYKPQKPMPYLTLAMVLCPNWAVETDLTDMNGEVVRGERKKGQKRYLCGLVHPDLIQGSYQLDAWKQMLINVEDMEAEVSRSSEANATCIDDIQVILEFDSATRFYFIAV